MWESTIAIEPIQSDFPILKHACGYVEDTAEASSNDTAAPFQIKAVLKLPFRYSASRLETTHRWARARVADFASKDSS